MQRLKLFLISCLINVSFGKDIFVNVEHADVAVTKLVELKEGLSLLTISSNITEGFYLVQLHTYNYPVALSQTDPIDKKKSINGTNIGLYLPYDDLNVLYVFSKENCTALLAIIHYDEDDPIPGGCNLAFQNKIAPYLKVHKSLSHSIFTVEYQMPSAINQLCENNTVKVDVYYYYGSDWDFSERSYFEAIKSMLKPENITENAVKIPEALNMPQTRRYFNYYKGMVTVYGIIAKYGNKTSAYVPAASFACENIKDHSCNDTVGLQWKILIGITILIGVFLYSCTFIPGLNYITHFLTSTLCIFIFVFIMLANVSSLFAIPIAGVVGFSGGFLWVCCWLKYYSKPQISACSSYITFGIIVALLILHFSQTSNNNLIRQLSYTSLYYWSIFTVTIIICCICCAPFHPYSDKITLNIIGTFTIILSSSYFYGAYIHYILINFIRRMSVENFKYAVINLPISCRDLILYIVCFALLCVGHLLMKKYRRRNGYESI